MAQSYIDYDRLAATTPEQFRQARPYPWINPAGLLTEDGYRRLRESLPDVEMFQRIFGKQRKFGQQSHDRFALEYEDGLDLPQPWQEFIDELRARPYRDWVAGMFGTDSLRMHFHWHYTPRGCSVSPHCDARRKLGSHIFYFNTEDDWDLGGRDAHSRRWRQVRPEQRTGVRGLRCQLRLERARQPFAALRQHRQFMARRQGGDLPGGPLAEGLHHRDQPGFRLRQGQARLRVLARAYRPASRAPWTNRSNTCGSRCRHFRSMNISFMYPARRQSST